MRLLLIIAIVVLGLGVALRRIVPSPRDETARISALRSERDGLAGNDDALLDRLKREAAGMQSVAWSDIRIQTWAGELGPRWRVRSGDARGVCIASREPDHVGDWTPFLADLREWSRLPGVSVEKIEIEATGPASRRQFARRSVTLRFEMKENSTQTKP